jgi:hypothetical protein
MDAIMIICCTVAPCVKGTVGVCKPCIKEVGTSCNDVIIVGIICITILLLTLIAVGAWFKLMADKRNAQKQDEVKFDESSTNKKNEAEYINRLLKHLENLANKEEVDKYDKIGSKTYINELRHLIKTGTVTDEKQEA